MGRVFATDSLITTLMCATRSVYSWDIIVERQGEFLFFDKRDGSNLDLLTGKEFVPDRVDLLRLSIMHRCHMLMWQCDDILAATNPLNFHRV